MIFDILPGAGWPGIGGTRTRSPPRAGDAVVALRQEGAQGFYKVWVSDAPIEAE